MRERERKTAKKERKNRKAPSAAEAGGNARALGARGFGVIGTTISEIQPTRQTARRPTPLKRQPASRRTTIVASIGESDQLVYPFGPREGATDNST